MSHEASPGPAVAPVGAGPALTWQQHSQRLPGVSHTCALCPFHGTSLPSTWTNTNRESSLGSYPAQAFPEHTSVSSLLRMAAAPENPAVPEQ